MVEWISEWAEAIIVAVIIATIIEMILPEGNSKKYIKVVIGIYILFTIISPVITKFTGKTLAVSDVLDLSQYIDEVKEKQQIQNILQQENASSIRDIYIGNLKTDIKNKLKGKGYIVTYLELDVGYDDNYTLNKITLSLEKEETREENNKENDNTMSNITVTIETVNEVSIMIYNEQNLESNVTNKQEQKSNLTNGERKNIKEYLTSVYEIQEKNIVIY